ncbi:MAG TPA: efflux RND transporter periplasmic adaptor subunit [Xanthobacteraceae bacterium]|jgi:RND family efflux transporter MFP subunit
MGRDAAKMLALVEAMSDSATRPVSLDGVAHASKSRLFAADDGRNASGGAGRRTKAPARQDAAAKFRKLACGALLGFVALFGLQSCGENKDTAKQQPDRGLRAYKVSARAESRIRRFPSILQPADLSLLSFEIGGQLKALTLQTGQKVQLGDVLAEIDPRSLQTQVDQATAGVQQGEAQVDNADGDFQRKQELLKRGTTTQAAFDQSKANLLTAQAQLDQARRQLELAKHNLDRSKLLAPFTGTISRVEVKSFAQVAAGQAILTLYSDDRFEIPLLVSAGTLQSLRIGQRVEVKVADLPDLLLGGYITELGSRAEQVSAFPIVVRLEKRVPGLNAGMSVEVAIEEPLIGGADGFLLPVSALVPAGGTDLRGAGMVFVYDEASSTVEKRRITVGGIRDNYLVVTSGVRAGDLVASAGVSYLTDGQKVKLLPLPE